MTTTNAMPTIIVLAALLVASTLLVSAAAAATGRCDAEKDLVIRQSQGAAQRGESAEYKVIVTNQCVGDARACAISRIYLQCGHFRSLVTVDPGLLRVVRPGVCLLNGGQTVSQNASVSFVYASYVRQDLYVLSGRCQ